MTGHCRICGVDLDEQDNELARLVAWPPCLLPGDLPADDELCQRCQADVKAAWVWRLEWLATPEAVPLNGSGG